MTKGLVHQALFSSELHLDQFVRLQSYPCQNWHFWIPFFFRSCWSSLTFSEWTCSSTHTPTDLCRRFCCQRYLMVSFWKTKMNHLCSLQYFLRLLARSKEDSPLLHLSTPLLLVGTLHQLALASRMRLAMAARCLLPLNFLVFISQAWILGPGALHWPSKRAFHTQLMAGARLGLLSMINHDFKVCFLKNVFYQDTLWASPADLDHTQRWAWLVTTPNSTVFSLMKGPLQDLNMLAYPRIYTWLSGWRSKLPHLLSPGNTRALLVLGTSP